MKIIKARQITEAVAQLIMDSNYNLGSDVMSALKSAYRAETSKLARQILLEILENAKIAGEDKIPICQDTGLAIVFVELGSEVRILGGDLKSAIQAGIRKGSKSGYLRKSVVNDPLLRKNTRHNSPGIVHIDIVPGSRLKLVVCPKGAGSENMSRVVMLKPGAGEAGVISFVLETVKQAGANCCPPGVIGVGIGGNLEMASCLAKKALLRKVGQPSKLKHIARLEKELLSKINKLGIGPMGLGGKTTALAVQIETAPCHMASLPVGVNLGCHAHRHKEIIL